MPDWAINIGINNFAVTQGTRHVLFADNTGFRNEGSRIKRRAEAEHSAFCRRSSRFNIFDFELLVAEYLFFGYSFPGWLCRCRRSYLINHYFASYISLLFMINIPVEISRRKAGLRIEQLHRELVSCGSP